MTRYKLLLTVLLLCSTEALAVEKIARVVGTEGTVLLVRYNKAVNLRNNNWLFKDDKVLTRTKSSVELQLIDGSLVNIGELAELVMLDLVYDPVKKDGYIDLNIVKGAFRIISGSIAKLGPDLMKLEIPLATVGIRGTNLVGRADEVGKKSFVILVPDPYGHIGELVVRNTEGIVILRKPNEGVTMIYPDRKLAKKKYTKKFIQELIKQVPKLKYNLHKRQFDSLFWFK